MGRRRSLKPSQVIQKRISKSLSNVIKRVQKDMQLEENMLRGRRAKVISFLESSEELAKRLSK